MTNAKLKELLQPYLDNTSAKHRDVIEKAFATHPEGTVEAVIDLVDPTLLMNCKMLKLDKTIDTLIETVNQLVDAAHELDTRVSKLEQERAK